MMHYTPAHALHTEEGSKGLKRFLQYFAYLSVKTVCRLRIDLMLLRSNPTDPVVLGRFTERLESLASNSVSWGFQDIHRLAQALLRVMLNLRSGIQSWDHSTAQLLADGLDVLGTLVYDRENEFKRRSAVVRLLNSLTP
jgi:chemotaxis protein histidine kinase CheA